jgi:hypothetical protein
MTKNLPSKRYDIFIDAFEKIVAAKQKEIRLIEGHQQEYIVVKSALEAMNFDNDSSIHLASYGVFVRIVATPHDLFETFAKIASRISSDLVARKLRARPGMACSMGGSDCEISYSAHTARADGSGGMVYLTIAIPKEGLRDLVVSRRERTSIEHVYELTPTSDLREIGPPNVSEIVF